MVAFIISFHGDHVGWQGDFNVAVYSLIEQCQIMFCSLIFARYHEKGIKRADRSWAVCEHTVYVDTIVQNISTGRVDTLVGAKKSRFVHNKRSFADSWPSRGSLGNVFERVTAPVTKPTIVRNE